MGADLSSGEEGPISSINVTPFVDVTLVLLVIFMVTAPVLVKETLGLKLPKAAATDSKNITDHLGIAVTGQGQILLNGKPVDDLALERAVRAAVSVNPKTQAIISADKESRHSSLVHAIDIVKGAGLERFALQVEKKE